MQLMNGILHAAALRCNQVHVQTTHTVSCSHHLRARSSGLGPNSQFTSSCFASSLLCNNCRIKLLSGHAIDPAPSHTSTLSCPPLMLSIFIILYCYHISHCDEPTLFMTEGLLSLTHAIHTCFQPPLVPICTPFLGSWLVPMAADCPVFGPLMHNA
jgi:hypothetical protein